MSIGERAVFICSPTVAWEVDSYVQKVKWMNINQKEVKDVNNCRPWISYLIELVHFIPHVGASPDKDIVEVANQMMKNKKDK